MKKKKEKRRSHRTPVSIRIDYSTTDKFLWDFASNINEGGVFVETNKPLGIGTTVHLKFFLPNLENPIETSGEVVWVGSSEISEDDADSAEPKMGMGIQFNELEGESKDAINQLIHELRKK